MTFRVDREMLQAMQFVRLRDGVPFSEQIRRGLRSWLEGEKGVQFRPPPERPKATRRSRARRPKQR